MTSRANRPTEIEVNESSPLNTGHQQNQTKRVAMDAETKQVLTKIAVDVVLLCCGKQNFSSIFHADFKP